MPGGVKRGGGRAGGDGPATAIDSVQILPDHVANQIAAGEVVAGPASVVKELVENSVDAGARLVEVALRNGGKTEVRVSDDGTGMSRADAVLALERHATSKIRSADDLRRVSSFGFRGEALPSIAAVSRFELHTAAGLGGGARVRVDHGRIRGVDDVPRRPGTTVTVRALFHDMPARAKFLRASAAETRAAGEALILIALANPRVGFRLKSNGRVSMDLSPQEAWLARIGQLWDDLGASLIPIDGAGPVDGAGGQARVGGYVQRPDAARPRGGRRYTFVNGRPFRDPALLKVVDEAFRSTVPDRVRPSVFLQVAIDPAAVDVNVHPAKAEVRFRDRDQVTKVVMEAVRSALARLDSTKPAGRLGARTGGAGAAAGGEPDAGGRNDRRGTSEAGGPAGSHARAGQADGRRAPSRRTDGRAGRKMPQLALLTPTKSSVGGGGEADKGWPAADESEAIAFHGPELWRLHDRYILTATREGLLIIDQHAAHERILYEEIMARFEEGNGIGQALLFPVTLRLSPPEMAAVEELSGALAAAGFDLDPFGERSYIMRAAPVPHARFDAEACLREMVRELAEGSPLVNSARDQHDKVAKSMACKGAIKAGDRLSQEETRELFDKLFATELPGHDVHGRPAMVRLSIEELDRRFGRS